MLVIVKASNFYFLAEKNVSLKSRYHRSLSWQVYSLKLIRIGPICTELLSFVSRSLFSQSNP